MKTLKTKLTVLVVCSAFMIPSVVGAEATTITTASPTNSSTESGSSLDFVPTLGVTTVNGTEVPGQYLTTQNSRVAYIPGGVGLVVVDRSIPLPAGAYYVED